MTATRIAIITGTLLLAGAASAATSSSFSSAAGEKTLAASAPISAPYLDFTSCKVNSKNLTTALLQVPDEDRGSVVSACGCAVASNESAPSKVDGRDRR